MVVRIRAMTRTDDNIIFSLINLADGKSWGSENSLENLAGHMDGFAKLPPSKIVIETN